MLIVVQHRLTDPASAFARGERLKRAEGAPVDTRVLQFYPSRDGDLVTCLWEGGSVAEVQRYVDDTLGDASINVSYAVESTAAFSATPPGIASQPTPVAA